MITRSELFFWLNTIHPLKVVTHFQFVYQSLKICIVPPQVFKIFENFAMAKVKNFRNLRGKHCKFLNFGNRIKNG
jgi:hypothetical protein